MHANAVICGTDVLPAYVMVISFRNLEENDRYKKDVKKIRKDCKLFFEKKDSEVLSNKGLSFVLDHVWAPLSESFIGDWGKDIVPHDIRWRYNDVQRRLGVLLFNWPPNEDANDDIIEAVSTIINKRLPTNSV
jgi:hypothetical protein